AAGWRRVAGRPAPSSRPPPAQAGLPSRSSSLVDLLDEALHEAVDHEVALGGVVASVAPAALEIVVAGLGLLDDLPVGADLLHDVALVAEEVGDERRAGRDREDQAQRA